MAMPAHGDTGTGATTYLESPNAYKEEPVNLRSTPAQTMSLRRYLATSDDRIAVLVRSTRKRLLTFTLPAPRLLVRPYLAAFLALRLVWHEFLRLFVAEPLFKAYCTTHGKNLRTSIYVHWIMGKGNIIVGDNVEIRGKCNFSFGARYIDRPTLKIGNNAKIGHDCTFSIGKRIEIGDDSLIASEVIMFDASGHPSDPLARLKHLPLETENVREIVIGKNVWIGQRAIISPGVKIGDNSIVSAGAVVITEVPANVIVAGNPARKIGSLQPPDGMESREALLAALNAGVTAGS